MSEKLGPIIVSVLATIAFGAVVVLWMFRPPGDSAVLNMLMGALATGYGTVLNYWLGSSAGSSRKDAVIRDLSTAPATPPAA